MERIAMLGTTPVYDTTTATDPSPARCRTCIHAGERWVNGPCSTDRTAVRYRLDDTGRLSTGGAAVALVDSCGWQPQRKCMSCAFFRPVHHHQPTASQYGGLTNATYLRDVVIGGSCGIPEEGVTDPATGRRVLCLLGPSYVPRLPDVDPSCATCEYCVIPGANSAWRGLMEMDGVVVRTAAGPYKDQLINRALPGTERMWRRLRLRQALARAVATDETGLRSTYGARIMARAEADGLVVLKLRFEASDRIVALALAEEGRTAVSYTVVRFGQVHHVGTIPAGQVEVTGSGRADDRVLVDLALHPYRRLFGLPRVRTQVVLDPPQLRLPLRLVAKAGGTFVVETSQGSAPEPVVLRQAWRAILAEATRTGPAAVAGVYETWARITAGLPRRTVAEPWSLRPEPEAEPFTPVCTRWLAGSGGLDLRRALGWRRFGDSMWDTDYQAGEFRRHDTFDHWRAFDLGARLAEAMDATLVMGGFYHPPSGTSPARPAPLHTCWQTPVRLDTDGDPAESWATFYDQAADRQMHLEWLDETDGDGISNRYRRHGYEMSRRAPQPAVRVYDRSDDNGAWDDDDGDDRHDSLELAAGWVDEDQIEAIALDAIADDEADDDEEEAAQYDRSEEMTTDRDDDLYVMAPQEPEFDLYCEHCAEMWPVNGRPDPDRPPIHTVTGSAGLACPRCSRPGFIIGEREEPSGEKARFVARYRSKESMIRKEQLRSLCCDGWLKEGSGRSWKVGEGWSAVERRRIDLSEYEERERRARRVRLEISAIQRSQETSP